jgi:hypothetical protein
MMESNVMPAETEACGWIGNPTQGWPGKMEPNMKRAIAKAVIREGGWAEECKDGR